MFFLLSGPYAHVCQAATKFGECQELACPFLHPCPWGRMCPSLSQTHPHHARPSSLCHKMHVRPVRTCKFVLGACASPECVMRHAPRASRASHAGDASDETKAEDESEEATFIVSGGGGSGDGNDGRLREAPRPPRICEFFNRKSGCLSRRSADFLCEFWHVCCLCGRADHGAFFCPLPQSR